MDLMHAGRQQDHNKRGENNSGNDESLKLCDCLLPQAYQPTEDNWTGESDVMQNNDVSDNYTN